MEDKIDRLLSAVEFFIPEDAYEVLDWDWDDEDLNFKKLADYTVANFLKSRFGYFNTMNWTKLKDPDSSGGSVKYLMEWKVDPKRFNLEWRDEPWV